MNILELSINDLKRISAVEIHPETGKPVILTGDNGNGKSSVLDSIILALENTGLDDPIRHGRPSGSVKLTLGTDKAEFLLERKVTKSGDKLTLTDANGIAVQKPQTFLNGLIGNYAFDPLEFTRLKAKDQVEALKAAAGLDFSELDAKRAQFYAERTACGRDGKELAAQLAAVPEPSADVPAEEVSASDLVERLTTMEAAKRDAEKSESEAIAATQAQRTIEARIDDLKAKLAAAQADLDLAASSAQVAREDADKVKAAAPTDEAIAACRSEISTVDETNRAIRQARKHRELTAKVKELRAKYASLDRRIEEVDEQKAEAIKDANLPIDGLELTDDGVMMHGTFFGQLSTAEQIRISTLVAMAQNPKLRIIIIREGALINAANLQMIAKMAAERGFQVWIEKFQEQPSDIGLHIVDGVIAFADGKEVTKEGGAQ